MPKGNAGGRLFPPVDSYDGGIMVVMSVGEELVDGDLVGEFQAALDAVSAADPLIGGDSGTED